MYLPLFFQMSSSLIWALTSRQNAFLKKQRHSGGAQFSSNKFNLTGTHNFSNCGLVNNVVSVTSMGVETRSSKFAKVTGGKKGGMAGIEAGCASRKDLTKKAKARYVALLKGKGPVTKNRVKRTRGKDL